MSEKNYVISIGGHLLHRGAKSKEELNIKNYEMYAEVIKKIKKRINAGIVVVCGGGDICREEMKRAKEMGIKDNVELDMIGIKWTHINAEMLGNAIGEEATIHKKTESEMKEILKNLENGKIPVCGGEKPGHSTDFDAALIAKSIKETGKDVVFIDARKYPLYDKDPALFKDAKKLDKISSEKLFELARGSKQDPGTYQIDLGAIEIIHKFKIKTIFIDGFTDPEEIVRAVEGQHSGTEIV
ncbi:MAG: hypothetical protein QXX38_01585 [Candidatus Aenigmatarchaeota archaeon]